VVEGGAYVIQEVSGIERRLAHDENTRIDRPPHVGDRIEALVDDRGRAVLIQNINQDEQSNGLSRALQEDGCSLRSWL
jgi:hypothetical protein